MILPALRLTRAEFDALPEYSCSLPTGTAVGKRWKRHDGSFDRAFLARGGKPTWMVGEYTREVMVSDRVVVGDMPPDRKGPLINLRCRIEAQVEITWYRPVIQGPQIVALFARDFLAEHRKLAHA